MYNGAVMGSLGQTFGIRKKNVPIFIFETLDRIQQYYSNPSLPCLCTRFQFHITGPSNLLKIDFTFLYFRSKEGSHVYQNTIEIEDKVLTTVM